MPGWLAITLIVLLSVGASFVMGAMRLYNHRHRDEERERERRHFDPSGV